MELVMRKGRKKRERGKREKPEEGRGSRKEIYDVWTLASHPAERSIAPEPASLARLEPWGSPVAPPWCGQPSPRPQPRAGQAELPPNSPPQPAHPSPPLPGPRSPPPPPTAPRAPITSLGKRERWKNQKGEGATKKNFFFNNVIIGPGGAAGKRPVAGTWEGTRCCKYPGLRWAGRFSTKGSLEGALRFAMEENGSPALPD